MTIRIKSVLQLNGVEISVESNVQKAIYWTVECSNSLDKTKGKMLELAFTYAINAFDVTTYLSANYKRPEYKPFDVLNCYPTPTRKRSKKNH